jgi:hypothetical protein
LAGGPRTVTAELRFRRLLKPRMDDKAWDAPDIIMQREVEFRAEGYYQILLPRIWKHS